MNESPLKANIQVSLVMEIQPENVDKVMKDLKIIYDLYGINTGELKCSQIKFNE